MIHEEYEQLTQRAKADGRVFEPFRKMLTNPVTRVCGPSDGLNRIADASSRELAEIFNSVYELMLMMLARFFAHGGETEEQLRLLSRGTLRMMASGLRPLGEALSRMPSGPKSAPRIVAAGRRRLCRARSSPGRGSDDLQIRRR